MGSALGDTLSRSEPPTPSSGFTAGARAAAGEVRAHRIRRAKHPTLRALIVQLVRFSRLIKREARCALFDPDTGRLRGNKSKGEPEWSGKTRGKNGVSARATKRKIRARGVRARSFDQIAVFGGGTRRAARPGTRSSKRWWLAARESLAYAKRLNGVAELGVRRAEHEAHGGRPRSAGLLRGNTGRRREVIAANYRRGRSPSSRPCGHRGRARDAAAPTGRVRCDSGNGGRPKRLHRLIAPRLRTRPSGRVVERPPGRGSRARGICVAAWPGPVSEVGSFFSATPMAATMRGAFRAGRNIDGRSSAPIAMFSGPEFHFFF